jgi:hypothetical protein
MIAPIASAASRRMRDAVRRIGAGLAGILLLAPHAASGCTLCASDTARAVRERLFEADFLPNLIAVAAPAPILFGAILLAARTPR